MKISVIVPTYRPKAYLYECLESLENQTLNTFEYEIIVILNGDREPYFDQIQDSLPLNGKLQHIVESSVSAARNKGLSIARGEYIAFIDDDDYVSTTYLEDLLCVSSPTCVGEAQYQEFQETDSATAHSGHMGFGSSCCCKLIHRDMIGSTRFRPFRNGQDSLFVFEISDKIKDHKLAAEACVYYRRLREDSAYHTQKGWYAIANRFRLMHEYSKIYWAHPSKYSFSFYCTRILASFHYLLSYLTHGKI